MKEMKYHIMIFAAAAMTIMASCTKNSVSGQSGQVPDIVAEAFSKSFPEATSVVWEDRAPYWVASFNDGTVSVSAAGRNRSAWYENNGNLRLTESPAEYNALPQAVRTAFESSAYATWRVEDTDVIRRDGMVLIYVIVAEGRLDNIEVEVDLYYSEDGVLVKEIVDSGNDYADFIPATPVSAVMSYISENYPSAGIVDTDVEDGYVEVEIIDGKVYRELLFTVAGTWVKTVTPVRYAELPAAVTAAFEASEYASWKVDDVEYVQTPEKNFYRFDLESWNSDLDLDISEDGSGLTVVTEKDEVTGLSEAVRNAVTGKYPGAQILDAGYDDGFLEVEINDGGIEKDVYFNGKGQWIWTEWDVRYSSLPEAVKSAILAAYPGYEVDDAKFIEKPDSSYYEIELEGNGDREVMIRITAEGNIIR